MRKLKIQVQVTADGYMGGPNGEMDWMTFPWSDDLNDYLDSVQAGVDAMVLGRRLAEGFIPTWAARPEHEDEATIAFMTGTPKLVISRTLAESPWAGATVAADLVAAVTALKERDGGDVIAYGGSALVRGLIEHGLADDLHLVVNPTSIGGGLSVFPESGYQRLRLVDARRFECGTAALHYSAT